MCIAKKGMLVSLSMGRWAGRKRDKETGAEACERKGAEVEAGVFTKRLLASAKLSPMTTCESRARQAIYKHSLPWLDSGVRLLPADLYFRFDREINELKAQHERAVAEFLDEYDQLVGEARYRMGSLFDPADYPSRAEVAGKFYFEVSYLPVPDAGDFRVESSKADLAALRKQSAEQGRKREAALAKEIASRVGKVASEFAAKIQPGKRFWDSVSDDLSELASLIDGLNVLGDEGVTELADGLKKLATVKAEDIRDDDRERKKVIEKADDIRKKAAQLGSWF